MMRIKDQQIGLPQWTHPAVGYGGKIGLFERVEVEELDTQVFLACESEKAPGVKSPNVDFRHSSLLLWASQARPLSAH